MIIQGSNNPIIVTLPEECSALIITLENDTDVLKTWSYNAISVSSTLSKDSTGLVWTAALTQDQTMNFEPGPVRILVKWISADDEDGLTNFAAAKDVVVPWSHQYFEDVITEEEEYTEEALG